MKNIFSAIMMIFFLDMPMHSAAQNYYRGEQTVIQPLQVMIDNYTPVTLPKEAIDDVNANRFDKFNAYTFIQIIHDNLGKDYHILFQTNFSGKILFLSYSNNLSALFNQKDKPLNVFVNSIRRVNEHLSAVQNADAAIKCIIERLNYCSN